MQYKEALKLGDRLGKTLSIGITKDGAPSNVIGVPWESTGHAFNMRTPDVYIAPEDLQDERLMGFLDGCKVIGFYVFEPLEEYSFLSRFKDVEDLNIYNGNFLRNLDFLKGMPEIRMLYVENAVLPDLNVLVEIKKQRRSIFSDLRCVGLCNCHVADLSAFEGAGVSFSEFLVWNPKDRDERQRWRVVSAHTRRYYELK